jgi:signal transduction histidine kinase/ActR/RegA family two-component response regulator
LNEITLIKAAAAGPYLQPPQPINSLLRFTPGLTRFHRVHVRGRVTLAWPGRRLCITDESQGLCVQTAQAMGVELGREVDVVGFPSEGEYTPTMTDAQYVPREAGAAIEPLDVTAEQVFHGEHDFELIRIVGQLLTEERSSPDPTLMISDGAYLFPAVLPRGSPGAETIWQNGSTVRITGICTIESDPQVTILHEGTAQVGSFRMLLRSTHDVEVLHTPSWWSAEHAVIVLYIVLAATMAAVVWVILLRHRVRSQTEVIRRNLDEAEALKATAESANHAKSAFVASMSHEIRTPLTGILGFADLMAAGELNSEQREFNNVVRSSAQSLLVIINDVLDFSRIEAGKIELESVEFGVRTCVEDALRPIQPLAAAKGLALVVEVEPEVPEWLGGDPHRLRQVLLNLAGNAVKFTDAGRITVRASAVQDPDPNLATVQFAVSDTGIGITEEQRNAIFEPFRQADGSITRRFGGTGLGLSISLRLVTLMNGRIWLESREGHGSTFYFTIRLPRASAPQEADKVTSPIPPVHQASLSILLAEDNPVNQRLLARLLQSRGHRVAIVDNGHAALQACRDTPYDLILMDVQMPEMDGLETTRRIRAQEQGGGRRIPIVAMTANAMQGDREQCVAAGMDGYLTKPLVTTDLDRVLALYSAAEAGSVT